MRYGASNGWLDGQPAVINRKVGKGSITYVGAWLDDSLMSKLTASWIQMSQIEPIISNVPEGVEICRRSGDGKSVVIVINHSTSSQSIALPTAMKDLLSNDGSGFATDLASARSRGAGIKTLRDYRQTTSRFAVSHISRKTSEMWGTRRPAGR